MSNLFTPFKIGSMKIKNRIVKAAAGSYSIDSGLNEQAIMFYENIAKGGTGLIWFEDLQWYDYSAKDVQKIIERVHSYGVKIGAQTYGSWQYASSSKHLQSPLEMDLEKYRHKELSTEQVHEVQSRILDICRYYRDCGFDAVELNCSSDHMFDTFLSRFWNISRKDEYSSESFENRARVVTELIREIKKECGKDFAIQILFNGIEECLHPLGDSSLCMTPEEAGIFAKIFEKAGADSLQIRSSSFGNHCAGFMPDIMHFGEKGNTGLGGVVDYSRHYHGMVDGTNDGVAAFIDIAASVKKNVNIPVGVVGNVDPRICLDIINSSIERGKIDFIVVNRPLIADPYMPDKLKNGKIDEIVPCNKCVNCFKAVADMFGVGYCRVNPVYIRGGTEEMPEGNDLIPSKEKKKVIVVGGGPAGMEAAAIAAKRGHDVTLYEASNSLGGRMNMAVAVKGKHDRIYEYKRFLEKRLEQLGVKINKNVVVTIDLIKALNPNHIVLATGGKVKAIKKEYGKLDKTYKGITMNISELGDRICVVGGNIIAYDYATRLVAEGKQVFLVSERAPENIGSEQSAWQRAVLNPWMFSKGSKIYGNATVEICEDCYVTINTSFGTKESIKCDSIVIAEELQKNLSMVEELQEYNLSVVGDCAAPCNILEAVKSGNLAARKI